MLLQQFVYVAILILIGAIVLSLRRKADGSRTGYKLLLVLIGILLGLFSRSGHTLLLFDTYFLKSLAVFLLVVLLFELSVRLNPDNVQLTPRTISMFFIILTVNIIVLGTVAAMLLDMPFIQGVIFAILLSSVEYFLVDKLKSEGDLANPLILFFAFSVILYYELQGNTLSNLIYFLKYIVLGLGMGVLVGIIVFRILRSRTVTPANELGLVSVAVMTYILTEQLSGSGLFAVLILGTFFGNSYVRKTSNMHSLSPFIFKTLEMLIYLLIGFVIVLDAETATLLKSFILFLGYVLLRFIVLSVYFKHYSFSNKLLLTFAPKGMILGVAILVFGAYSSLDNSLLNVMVFVLIYGLFTGTLVEYIEQQKELRLDKAFKTLMTKKFGRKRDILRRKSAR